MIKQILPLTSWRLLFFCSIACMGMSQASADIAHRYSFTSDATDSVGTADGTVVDGGEVRAFFIDGQLDVSANTGEGSDVIVDDAYVNFPNNIISGASTNGTGGQLTVEFWASASENRNWAALFSAGTSEAGEDRSDSGDTTDYLQVIPQNGSSGVIRSTTHTGGFAEGFIDFSAPLSTANTQHIVSVYDQSGGLPGTVSMYVDGALIGTGPVAESLDIGAIDDNNVWLGRSQWNDSVFDGSYDEFRVYDAALSDGEVAVNSYLGPDAINTGGSLSIEVDANSGQITMTNNASAPVGLEYYSITSAGSALDDAAWTSLDEANYDAVDGGDAGSIAGDSPGEGWDAAGGSDASRLVEHFLGESGSIINANETLILGNAFDTSVFGSGNHGDLEFSFSLAGGGQAAGEVQYVSSGTAGDFDNDSDVDGADFLFWQRSLGDLASLSQWESNYGAGVSPSTGAVSSVPEPSSIALCCFALGLVVMKRRRLSC